MTPHQESRLANMPRIYLAARPCVIDCSVLQLVRVGAGAASFSVHREALEPIRMALLDHYCQTGRRIQYLVVDEMMWCWIAMHPEIDTWMRKLPAPVTPSVLAVSLLGVEHLVVLPVERF